jgi:hypothetical protein
MDRMRAPIVAVVAAALVLGAAPTAAARPVERGTILPGVGATVTADEIRIAIGMKRARVVKLLGQPIFANAFGFMQYSKNNLFDLYVNQGTKRVDLIGISGPRFCLPFGLCMLERGGLGRVKTKFGGALKRVEAPDGISYVVRRKVDGGTITTSFGFDGETNAAKLIQVFIGGPS